MTQNRKQQQINDARRKRCQGIFEKSLSQDSINFRRIRNRPEMGLMILFGIINGLNRKLKNRIIGRCIQQHLHFELEPVIGNAKHFLHKTKRNSS